MEIRKARGWVRLSLNSNYVDSDDKLPYYISKHKEWEENCHKHGLNPIIYCDVDVSTDVSYDLKDLFEWSLIERPIRKQLAEVVLRIIVDRGLDLDVKCDNYIPKRFKIVHTPFNESNGDEEAYLKYLGYDLIHSS